MIDKIIDKALRESYANFLHEMRCVKLCEEMKVIDNLIIKTIDAVYNRDTQEIEHTVKVKSKIQSLKCNINLST